MDSLEGALAAAEYGVKRIELCSALTAGGLTPSFGLLKACSSVSEVETHCILRPREGGFVYSDSELRTMKEDLLAAADLGARGVVFGALAGDFTLAKDAITDLVKLAQKRNLETTFHRAFDFIEQHESALKFLIDCGIRRVLTSGKAQKAQEGIPLLRRLTELASGRIQIMAGSGIAPANAAQVASTGVQAIHFTIHKPTQVLKWGMGQETAIDREKIEGILEAIQ